LPLYDYRCRDCSKVTEVRHAFREAHQGACPACGGELARVFTPAGIVFKGSGFYLTDSRKAAEAKASAAKPSDAAKPTDAAKPADPAKPAESTTSAPASTPAAAAAPAASSGGDSTPKKSENAA
jgi:putative FmdB family regulatory protein